MGQEVLPDATSRVFLGVPGMEKVFPHGVRPGSLILIAGPPGSGKTLLAMQLLMEMTLQPAPRQERKPSLFISADEDDNILRQEAKQLYGKPLEERLRIVPAPPLIMDIAARRLDGQLPETGPAKDPSSPQTLETDTDGHDGTARPLETSSTRSQGSETDAGEEAETPEEYSIDLNRAIEGMVRQSLSEGDSYQKGVRRKAVDIFVDYIGKKFGKNGEWPYAAIGLDGLLNLRELRGVTADERRDALRATAEKLRRLVRWEPETQPRFLAAIITAEVPAGEYSGAVRQVEEYLADVVIHVGIDAPAPRKRRRFLDVRKCRYGESLLGEHSLWIMSPDEVDRRRMIAATMGWSHHALKCIRPGVVVFPRMRWRSRTGIGPFSANIEKALVELRSFASSIASLYSGVLKDEEFGAIVERVIHRGPLSPKDAEVWAPKLGLVLRKAIKATRPDGSKWTWPSSAELATWRCDLPSDLPTVLAQLPRIGFLTPLVNAAIGLLAAGKKTVQIHDLQGLLAPLDRMVRASTPSNSLYAELALWSDGSKLSAIAAGVELLVLLCHKMRPQNQCATFGVPGLDKMFGLGADGRFGIARGTSTVIIGGAGTGKSTLAYCFVLKGLLGEEVGQPEDALFLSFDERHKAILREYGRLCVSPYDQPAHRLARQGISQVLLTDNLPPDKGRLCFIHQNPVNADLDELMHLLDRQVNESSSGQTPKRHRRLVIDSLSDLERNIRDPLVFNDFVATLLNMASDWGVTVLLVYEGDTIRDRDISSSGSLSFLSDNVVLLRQVQVNDVARKCLAIQKARGRRHDPAVAELIYVSGPSDGFHVEVRKGFEGMTRVLTGHPEAANIELRMFHENDPERIQNRRFYRAMRRRFGDRVRYVPFDLGQGRRAFWHGVKGGDVRPDADVTVVSLDQPWVRVFADKARRGDPLLACWEPKHADPSQRLLVSQMLPRLREHAEVVRAEEDQHRGIRSMLAWPHYFDFGILLERRDILNSVARPTHWDTVIVNGADRPVPNECDQHSFERIIGKVSRERGVPGFAFNMASVDTVACVFIEMAWNFYATQDFLGQCNRQWNVNRVSEALAFLARLRWDGVLPFPCTLEHCAKAAYSRVWYANIPNLLSLNKNQATAFRPVPFFTSAAQFMEHSGKLRQFMRQCLDRAEALRGIHAQRNDGAMSPYPERLADFAVLQEVLLNKERFARRQLELSDGDGGARPIHGWSCCGAWFLSVLSSGGNADLGWSVVQEALDPRRIEERAFAGAGLPALATFYRQHGNSPVPGLQDTTFGSLEQDFFGRVRPRETVLGMGLPGAAEMPDSRALDYMSSLPEVLHGLVMGVLASPESDPRHENCQRFIRSEVERLFLQTDSELGRPVVPTTGKYETVPQLDTATTTPQVGAPAP